MSKRLVVCCDGTWNDPEDRTNIAWIKNNVVDDGREQRVHYDPGIGTRWYDEKVGGALGAGLSRNVRQAYAFIRANYRPGDEIYCFGFSRGAFTVRSLCGFMEAVGRLESEDEIDAAYAFYRINEPDDPPNALERLFRPESRGPIAVRFLGVFDTVGALGVPFEIRDDACDLDGATSLVDRARRSCRGWLDAAGDRLRRPVKGFHDTRLGTVTEHACHALAIDEQRAMFAPTLWSGAPGQAIRLDGDGRESRVPQVVEQVWFAGVHSDVGGGYQDRPRLADVPLLWMVEQAAAAGLRFAPGAIDALRAGVDVLAPQHDSMTATWRKLHRKLKLEPVTRPMTNGERRRRNPAGDLFPVVETPERVDSSVRTRCGREVRVLGEDGTAATAPYQPANLPADGD